ncbi:MAG: hypothetical protein ACK5OI_09155, partial [Curvibacter sp.]
ELRRWVTTSIHQAIAIEKSVFAPLWSHIFVCMHAPLSVRSGTVFEVVKEVYKSERGEDYVYGLANGMTFMFGGDEGQITAGKPSQLRLIYSNGRLPNQ